MFNLKLNNPELDQKSRIIYAGLFFFAISNPNVKAAS